MNNETEPAEKTLIAALDDSIEAAIALKMPEQELVHKLVERIQSRAFKFVLEHPDVICARRMCNPEAGP